MYLWPLREGEKISGNGAESFGGESCCGGRRKCGREGPGVAVFTEAEGWKSWGVRGAGVRKRWVFGTGAGVRGGCCGIAKVEMAECGCVGDVGSAAERRRRLLALGLEYGASKSISASPSSSSSSSCSPPVYLPCVEGCSIDCATSSSKSSLPSGLGGLLCDPSSMLSIRFNFLAGFARGVCSA
jgi:hypothetical protein